MNSQFKNNAEEIAFKAFMHVIKKYRVYFPVLTEIYRLSISNSINEFREKTVDIVKKFSPIMPSELLVKNINWGTFHNNIKGQIERNAQHMGNNNTECDYLIHCVNTMIQVIIECGIMRRNEELGRRIPRLDQLGNEIFTLASKKLFGADFVEPTNDLDNNITPQNTEENEFVANIFNKLMSKNVCYGDAMNIVKKELDKFRKRKKNKKSTLRGEDFYVNYSGIDENELVSFWVDID